MSDVVRNYLTVIQRQDLIDVLDAERQATACWRKTAQDLQKEVADLKKKIVELETGLQNIASADTSDWCRPVEALKQMALVTFYGEDPRYWR